MRMEGGATCCTCIGCRRLAPMSGVLPLYRALNFLHLPVWGADKRCVLCLPHVANAPHRAWSVPGRCVFLVALQPVTIFTTFFNLQENECDMDGIHIRWRRPRGWRGDGLPTRSPPL